MYCSTCNALVLNLLESPDDSKVDKEFIKWNKKEVNWSNIGPSSNVIILGVRTNDING